MSDRKPAQTARPSPRQIVAQAQAAEPIETSFAEVVTLIEQARQRAYQAVNSELVGLYWRIGEYISAKLTLPSGARAWWIAWRSTSRARCQASAVSRAETCFG